MTWCSMNRMTLIVTIAILAMTSCVGTIGNGHVANGGHIDEVDIVMSATNIIVDNDLLKSLDISKLNFYSSHGLLTMQYDNETIVPIQDGNTLYYYVELR